MDCSKLTLTRRLKPVVWSFDKCRLCKDSLTRKFQLMPMVSTRKTHILLISSMPNSIEDIIGRPFIGIEGDILDTLLLAANIERKYLAFTYGALCHSKDLKTDNYIWCLPNLKETVSVLNPAGIVYVGVESRNRYRKGFVAYRSTHITTLPVLVKSGGISSPLFMENVNRLRALVDEIAPF